jgi:hypothetical protein
MEVIAIVIETIVRAKHVLEPIAVQSQLFPRDCSRTMTGMPTEHCFVYLAEAMNLEVINIK